MNSQARGAGVASPELLERIERQERELAELRARLAAWEGAFERLPRRLVEHSTISGAPVDPLYTPADLPAEWDYLERLGLPGEFPFTRGPYTSMYRTRLWTMRQFAGFGTATQTNRRYKYLLEHGQTGLSVAFDFPTLMGYDSDHPRSLGEVGRCGVAISSLADMETLFDGIPLDQVSVSMTINGPAIILFCFYVVAAEKQGISAELLRGTVQNDILKEYQAQHAWIYPPEPALRLIVDMFEWASQHAPRYNPISISGYHIREAGSTAAQELAFTLRNGFEYVERGIARGLDVDEFAPRLSFFFDVHNDFFEEVAKFRAARRIWARRLRDVYGAKNPESWRLRTHAQTAGVSLVAEQAENNIVRVAYQALAAVLGGTQSLHTNSMDETLALPTEKSVRIALRTQQIIAFETGVSNTIDPLAGSYFVEATTDRLEREAEELFEQIDTLGGVVRGIETGYFQREIALSAERQQREIESGERIVVGINAFTEGGQDSDIDILKIGAEPEREQRERLAVLRADRDEARCQQALAGLQQAARSGTNVVEPMLDCVRAYCTLFEIRHALEEVFGAFREPVFF
ncbi:MAG TPA: methylmalonyl-CoA mutase family protein [Longimicrobiales bacterium]|nr:methylmalonyl-CoA mutase family protein [Longimicrobiales bacterium]